MSSSRSSSYSLDQSTADLPAGEGVAASTRANVGGRTSSLGLVFALAAYLVWGGLPLYFIVMAPASPFEIVACRVLFSLLFCAILLTVTRGWNGIASLLRQPRLLATLAVAGAVIYLNWQVYVLATTTGHVIEAALGYFMNPLVTVLLGVLVLHERLRFAQWSAMGVSAIAVLVIALGYGAFPWISLVLALSFGFYGLVKNRLGGLVGAVAGLTLETLWLTPLALVQLAVVGSTAGLTFATEGVGHALILASAGIVTAIPLLLFAGAARRLPLSILGFVQYLAPFLQLLVGAFVLGEAMPLERWIGFALVWTALAIFTVDFIVAGRRKH
ncbi:EamA family transporter RarD [Rathayibacter toxicus]|uniref:EamA family transporter RarD n=1 Tax=Rathayibacter toxicus TaxID=145458 RepID=A0A2S5Y8V2_9MICO|nr:EamA family transporter RarD [Rathayibacter toxicus]PPG23179.1 EamA family transporter RarD [Rathayibacter toxicus]PPG47763.1 EamA family transporter RarD [Rathayibacter toxicus]PPH24907.1 EamA family transporter RarD [Rathayibacter toxicus]PPH58831.1 EamA family transporter RarD [Rathayibacter toxicus]PPH60827.1 EamA family transporter RarD [Rathayibacter toxicus]